MGDRKYTVYEVLDGDGNILYCGISQNLSAAEKRMKSRYPGAALSAVGEAITYRDAAAIKRFKEGKGRRVHIRIGEVVVKYD